MTSAPEPAPLDPVALERENRRLARRLERIEENVVRMERLSDSNSRILSNVMAELDAERARSQQLLLNVLPQRAIDRLNAGETVIAEAFDAATVLFSDFVSFTAISARLAPTELVAQLNRAFSAFDAICADVGVEKIKTIGDAYLAVGGLPGTAEGHARAVAELALRMRDAVTDLDELGGHWQVRIGIHTGPVVAGILGMRKFAYDVWGDTVNVASRLETTAEPGTILVSEDVATALADRYITRFAGSADLKGKGATATFELVGRA